MPVKAYKNLQFLASPAARTIRILAEYLEPENRFRREHIDRIVVFFGSARAPSHQEAQAALAAARQRQASPLELEFLQTRLRLSRYYEDARELARLLTGWACQEQEESLRPAA